MRILVVDDEPGILNLIVEFLQNEGHDLEKAANGSEAQAALINHSFDMVLLDLFLPGLDGNELLREIKQKQPDSEVVIITGYGSIPTAMKSFNWGAHSYIRKPFDLKDDLGVVVKEVARTLELRRFFNQYSKQQLELEKLDNLISESPAMKGIVKQIHSLKDNKGSVLITGENHTGKAFIARIIHNIPADSEKGCVYINSKETSELLEKGEIHLKNNKTIQRDSLRESLKSINCRTLVIERLATLSKDNQKSLLEILRCNLFNQDENEQENNPVRVIGIVETIADSGKQPSFLDQELGESFSYHINVPSLNERSEDILPLAYLFLKKACGNEINSPIRISPPVLEFLQIHTWCENLLEMSDLVMTIILKLKSNVITIRDMLNAYTCICKDSQQDLDNVLQQLVNAEKTTLARIFDSDN
ncbi:MAG: sigma-54-dependent Fis family transcriptional regulator [Calditrichaeota bacterium]|jgi:DNA-binding NtrC family response regulator|nr:sigma-54-dependent Fis family transcriptional regulator [Calditrichota bacterium]